MNDHAKSFILRMLHAAFAKDKRAAKDVISRTLKKKYPEKNQKEAFDEYIKETLNKQREKYGYYQEPTAKTTAAQKPSQASEDTRVVQAQANKTSGAPPAPPAQPTTIKSPTGPVSQEAPPVHKGQETTAGGYKEPIAPPGASRMWAYDHGLPCLNHACKSYGKSHPNCLCYPQSAAAGFAEGGEVDHFCSKDRPHKPECEYFDDGGVAGKQQPTYEDSIAQGGIQAGGQGQSSPVAPSYEDSIAQGGTELTGPVGPSIEDSISQGGVNADDYSGVGQTALASLEGAAQGVAGPLATGAEMGLSALGVPGISAKDMAARQAIHPLAHDISEYGTFGAMMALGLGEFNAPTILGNLAASSLPLEAMEAMGFFGKMGAAAIQGAAQNMALTSSDEITKAMLGRGDPEGPVSAALTDIGISGLIGAGAGSVFNVLGQAGQQIGKAAYEEQMGTKLKTYIAGVGYAAALSKIENVVPFADRGKAISELGERYLGKGFESSIFNDGLNAYPEYVDKMAKIAVTPPSIAAGAAVSLKAGYTAGMITKDAVESVLSPIAKNISGKLGSRYGEAVANRLFSIIDPESPTLSTTIEDIMNYSENVERGAKKINKGVQGLFQAGGAGLVNLYADDRNREKLRKAIDDNSLDQQISHTPLMKPLEIPYFAEGGEVKPLPTTEQPASPLSQVYPEQDIMLNSAKARIYNYLKSQKPQDNMGPQPFDTKIKDVAGAKSYDKLLDLANNPLSVLPHIKDGTLTPRTLEHFKAMYPEIHNQLSKRITEHITEHQLKMEKPSYKIRQGLSMFMGVPMDSSQTPQSIMAAQGVFQSQPQESPPEKPVTKPKRNTSKLGNIAKNYMTPNQSRAERQQK